MGRLQGMTTVLRRGAQYTSSVTAVARTQGPRECLRFTSFRAAENFGDWWWDIDTMGSRSPADLGYTDRDFHEYGPASYEVLRFCLDRLTIRAGKSVFVDFGCGLGRAVIVAGARPFGRVIGIDASRELCAGAARNVARAASRLRCPVEIIASDARTFAVPDDADIFFFNNPFFGSVLGTVVGTIRASLRAHPREAQIVYGNCRAFDEMIRARESHWIEKTLERRFYKDFVCAFYRCLPHRA